MADGATRESREARRGGRRESTANVLAKIRSIFDCFLPMNEPLTLTDIQRVTRLPMTTVHRLVGDLVSQQFLVRYENHYQLGWSITRWAAGISEGSDLVRLGLPVVEQLRDATNETVSLLVNIGSRRLCVASVSSHQPVRRVPYTGETFPLQGGASSKVLLAFDDEATSRVLKRGLRRYTPQTIVDPKEFVEELREVRSKGYAISRAEIEEGVGSVAAPVFDVHGRVVAALNLSIPIQRVLPEYQLSMVEPTRSAAETLSRRLGWRPDAVGADAAEMFVRGSDDAVPA